MEADTQTLTPMPEGFYWKPRCHLDTLPTGLFLHGEQVASMQQRVDGSWLARLTPEDGVACSIDPQAVYLFRCRPTRVRTMGAAP